MSYHSGSTWKNVTNRLTDFIPLPGTKHAKYLKENAEAIKVEFTKEDEEKIRKSIDEAGGAKGARYPEAILHMCFGDTLELSTE